MITKTTANLHLTWRDQARTWLAQRDPIALLSGLIVAAIIGAALIRQLASAIAPVVAMAPTPQLPIYIIATAPAQPIPVAETAAQIKAALPNTLTKAIVVYGAPDPATAIGAVEQGRPYQLRARWGAEWLQLDVSGSGVVYARTSDVLSIPGDLADLQPAPAPHVVYVSVPGAPAVEQPYEVTNNEPARAVATPAVAAQPYQVLSERQQNIQNHYVESPTLAPMEQTDVTKAWAAEQYRQEHP